MERVKDDMPKRMLKTPPKPHDSGEELIEMRSDGEERFRKAVHAAAKSGPKHRDAKR